MHPVFLSAAIVFAESGGVALVSTLVVGVVVSLFLSDELLQEKITVARRIEIAPILAAFRMNFFI